MILLFPSFLPSFLRLSGLPPLLTVTTAFPRAGLGGMATRPSAPLPPLPPPNKRSCHGGAPQNRRRPTQCTYCYAGPTHQRTIGHATVSAATGADEPKPTERLFSRRPVIGIRGKVDRRRRYIPPPTRPCLHSTGSVSLGSWGRASHHRFYG